MEKETEKIFDFNVKQYEEHHKLLITDMNEERQMERYVLIACGLFYSWLATNSEGERLFLLFASFIPIVIVLLSLVRSHALFNGVNTKSKYLRELEVWIYTNVPSGYKGPKGWETFLDVDGKYVEKYKFSQHLFWYMLLALTITASVVLIFCRL